MTTVSKYLKARKQHQCELCWGKILVGETYERQAVFDGRAWTFKSHIDCSKLANKLFTSDNEGIGSDGFMEAVTEKWKSLSEWDGDKVSEPTFLESLEQLKEELLP